MQVVINNQELENQHFYITKDDETIGYIDLELLKAKALAHLKFLINEVELYYNKDKGFISKRQQFRINEFRKIALNKLVSLFDKEEYTQEEFNDLWNKWAHTSERLLENTVEEEEREYKAKREGRTIEHLNTIARGAAPVAYITDWLAYNMPLVFLYLIRNTIFLAIGLYIGISIVSRMDFHDEVESRKASEKYEKERKLKEELERGYRLEEEKAQINADIKSNEILQRWIEMRIQEIISRDSHNSKNQITEAKRMIEDNKIVQEWFKREIEYFLARQSLGKDFWEKRGIQESLKKDFWQKLGIIEVNYKDQNGDIDPDKYKQYLQQKEEIKKKKDEYLEKVIQAYKNWEIWVKKEIKNRETNKKDEEVERSYDVFVDWFRKNDPYYTLLNDML